jgi:hypothetical protein
MRGPVLDCAGDALAHDRSHGGGEKAEIHDRDCDLVAIDEGMPAEHGVDQAGAVLVFAQAVLVTRHPLELEGVDRGQAGVELDEAVGIAEVRDPVAGREGKVIIAARTDAIVLVQLDLVHDFTAARTLLPEALRNIALLAVLGFERWLFKNGHGF